MFTISPRHHIRRSLFGAVPLALLAASVAVPTDAARPPISSPIPAVKRALAKVTSYQSNDMLAPPGQGVIRAVVVTVRKGHDSAFYATVTQQGPANGSSFMQVVLVGTRFCGRTSRQSPYQCKVDAALAARQRGDFDAMAGIANVPPAVHFMSVPPKMVGNQRCDGYSFQPATNGQETDILYVSAKTNLPCEVVERGSTGHGSIIWSRFNDPKLAIPTIK